MSDAVYWTHRGAINQRPARAWNMTTKTYEGVIDDLGRPVMERVPPTGRIGGVRELADIARTSPMPGSRYISALRADGHVVSITLRSAAAAVPGNDTSFATLAIAKVRHLGGVLVGECPVDLALRRTITDQHLVAPLCRADYRAHAPCALGDIGPRNPPCKHFLAEDLARKDRRRREDQQREDARKTGTDRQADAMVDFIAKLAAGSAMVSPSAPLDGGPPPKTEGRGK